MIQRSLERVTEASTEEMRNVRTQLLAETLAAIALLNQVSLDNSIRENLKKGCFVRSDNINFITSL
jgi:hypothetical protein